MIVCFGHIHEILRIAFELKDTLNAYLMLVLNICDRCGILDKSVFTHSIDCVLFRGNLIILIIIMNDIQHNRS